jgi:SAM-dependent methyltransferase
MFTTNLPMDILGITLSPCCNSKFFRKDCSAVCSSCGKSYPIDGNCLKLSTEFGRGQQIKKNGGLLKLAKLFLRPIIRAYENKLNTYYERSLTDRKLAEWFRSTYLPFTKSDAKLSVLDFGCGRGLITALSRNLGFHTVSLDMCKQEFWKKMPQVQFVELEYLDGRLPFEDANFDLCFHFMVLGYLKEPLKNLKEIKRILKKGGYLILHVANKDNLYTITTGRFTDRNYKLYSLEELKSFIALSGFEIRDINMERFYAPLFPQSINFIRLILSGKSYIPWFDRDSVFVKLTPNKYRGVINILARA